MNILEIKNSAKNEMMVEMLSHLHSRKSLSVNEKLTVSSFLAEFSTRMLEEGLKNESAQPQEKL